MSEKRFTVDKDGRTILDSIDDSYCECVNGYEAKQYCKKLNELHEEKENCKCNYSEIASENSILWNEVLKLQEQGALPSYAFKNYLDNLKKKNKLKVVLHG